MSAQKTELEIRIYGDPVLRKKSRPVAAVSEDERRLFDQMLELMRSSGGVGLAAPQVGVDKMMLVAEVPGLVLKIADPKILKKTGSDILEEGCLSVPGVCIPVNRPRKIILEFLDEHSKKKKMELEGLIARIVQHEMDHLAGKLIVDYAGITKKIVLKNKLKKIESVYNEKLRQSGSKSCQMPL